MSNTDPKSETTSKSAHAETHDEGVRGFVPRLPDPFEVQREVAREILGLHMAEHLF